MPTYDDYGDRQNISILLRKLKSQAKEAAQDSQPDMIAALRSLGDYDGRSPMEFHELDYPWSTKMLPSDICKDLQERCLCAFGHDLGGLTEMHWERGDITFLYRGDAE
ncbi:hypothetical protein TCAL_16827 [Tigriopus californicus]|uniref:Uncharacterized protein n=1 Tax=Tigriopus californicus TaxID=6832 RepID=A0A553PA39_TIGCA|nr:hypothetical protein TCAL_16827 [Tigriopus californicus]